MESSRKQFVEKYKISNNENNQTRYKGKGQYKKMQKLKKALATGLIALTATVSIVGCKNGSKDPETNIKQTIETYNFEEPTKADGTAYTTDEKEHINTVIQTKNSFVNRILEKYEEYYENEQTIDEEDIGILKTTNYGTLIVDKKHEKILCSYLEEDGKYKETVVSNYTDNKNYDGGTYSNDENFKGIVSKEYTVEDFANGAEALYEYKKENYNEFEEQDQEVIIEKNEKLNLKEDVGYEIGD